MNLFVERSVGNACSKRPKAKADGRIITKNQLSRPMNVRTTGQKILHFPITKIVIGMIVVIGIYTTSQYFLHELLKITSLPRDLQNLLIGVVSSVLAVFAYLLLFKFYEKRKISELSLSGITKNLTMGIVLGATLQSLTVFVIWLNGAYSIVAVNSWLYLLPGITMAFSSAVFEEILMRGILFRITEEKLGSYMALIISALIFGALHLGNPNSTLLLAFGLAIQAGLLLGTAYIYTRNLWFPIAIHFAWNFFQSGIFGAAVSGNSTGKSLFTSEINGADWFTGGAFGPEGSLQATAFCLIATIVLFIRCFRQKKIIAPFWVAGLK